MKYAGIIKNDFSAAPGVSTTFFTQGCPHRCKNCHNKDTWDFNGGKDFTPSVLNEIIEALTANNIKRSFCIMGGEPLCSENELLTLTVIKEVKNKLPNTPIFIWSGYTYEELKNKNNNISEILELCDYLIDGPYIDELRDITLQMRGSSNQCIISLHEIDKK